MQENNESKITKLNKTDLKKYTLCDSIYIKFWKKANVINGDGNQISDWSFDSKEQKETFGGDGNILYFVSGSGYMGT